MTFIDWSDPAEMLGLLVEYVVDERNDARDPERRAWLDGLAAELLALADGDDSMSPVEPSAPLRAIRETRAGGLEGDPVLTHLDDCIAELERIRGEDRIDQEPTRRSE